MAKVSQSADFEQSGLINFTENHSVYDYSYVFEGFTLWRLRLSATYMVIEAASFQKSNHSKKGITVIYTSEVMTVNFTMVTLLKCDLQRCRLSNETQPMILSSCRVSNV